MLDYAYPDDEMKCPECDWQGWADDALLTDDGALICPECGEYVEQYENN